MDNYQPKYQDPTITLPFVADKVRNKGSRFYDFDNGQKSSIEVGNDTLYKIWRGDATHMANARVQSTLSSQRRHLQPVHPRLVPYNRSGQPFFVNIDQAKQSQSVSGAGNTTYSARLSDADRESRRKRILERLGNNYEKYDNKDTSIDVRQQQMLTLEEQKEREGDFLLDQIMEKINNNDYKYELLQEIYKLQNYVVNNIWKWNDYQKFKSYIEKLDLLQQQIEASATIDIAEELKDKRQNYIEKLLESRQREIGTRFLGTDPARDYALKNAFEKYQNILDDYLYGMSDFLETSYSVIMRLNEYVKANTKGIGQSETVRKQLAKALTYELKLTKKEMEAFRKRNEEYFDKLKKENTKFFEDLSIEIPPEVADDWARLPSLASLEAGDEEEAQQLGRQHPLFGNLPYMADETQWIRDNLANLSDQQLVSAFNYYKYLRDEARASGDVAKARQEQSRIDALLPDGGRLEQILFADGNVPPAPEEIRPVGLGIKKLKKGIGKRKFYK